MKYPNKKLVSVLLAVAMVITWLLSFGGMSATAIAQNKISPELLSEFESLGATETILAYVEIEDIDHEAVMAEFQRKYPNEYNAYMNAISGIKAGETTEYEDWLLQRAVELKREVYRQFYAESNSDALAELVQEEDQLFVSEYSPIALIKADRNTVLELAYCETVTAISEYVEYEDDVEESELKPGLTSEEVVSHLDLSNQITRADILRDQYNLKGRTVKIGILEAEGVPDTTDEYLQEASITIRPGDEGSNYHATTIALILAAVDADGVSHGIVPSAQLYCANINNDTDIYSDIEWMISSGVNIINASFGYTYSDGSYDARSQWIDHIAAVHDVHFVKSAGNSGGYVTSPGMSYNAITVGGLYANGSDEVSGFTMYVNSSYAESGINRPEKPNLVANVYFGDYYFGDTLVPYRGTSFAAPQVVGIIAQLCCWDDNLKFRQSVVGAVLAASAAEKVDAVGNGYKGDSFVSSIAGSAQISNKEGAGIVDARWAWGILTNGNYWHLKLNGNEFPYEKTVTINTNINSVSRVAIFWTKNNTDIDHTTNVLGSDNPPLTDLNLYIYDAEGNLVASSTALYSNFEIVQFVPSSPGIYTIRITGTTEMMEYVGLALW